MIDTVLKKIFELDHWLSAGGDFASEGTFGNTTGTSTCQFVLFLFRVVIGPMKIQRGREIGSIFRCKGTLQEYMGWDIVVWPSLENAGHCPLHGHRVHIAHTCNLY